MRKRPHFVANAFLACIAVLLVVVGIDFAKNEIGHQVRKQATGLAHSWSMQVAANAPDLADVLNLPSTGSRPLHGPAELLPSGPILGYRIHDLDGNLRIQADRDMPPDASSGLSRQTRVTLPLISSGNRIGSITSVVDTGEIHDLLIKTALKFTAIFSAAIALLLVMSLLVRVNSRQEALRNSNRLIEHNVMTGMPNKLALLEMLSLSHSQEISQHTTTNLFLVNLDRFTSINERLGHAVGDLVLRLVAERLRLACGDAVICTHINGDTFGIIADEKSGKQMHTTLQQVFSQPFKSGQNVIRLSASIGAATSTAGLYTSEQLHRNAELALRAAKTNGGHQLVTYDSDTVIEFQEIDRVATVVEDACLNNDFELHYQPVVDSRTRKLKSFEALLRLTTADGEIIGPDKFIPIAERIGRIEEIGLWTLREACKTIAGLPRHISMAVNLSVQQFNSGNLVAEVARILEDTRVDPGRIELEVTEGIMIGDADPVFDQLSQLQALGVKIALDDFGTGYSSLNYLWRFNFDKLKIDQAFIRASDHNAKAETLLAKIVDVGRVLNMKVTAEGIETEDHASRVAELGCDYSQGYLFGKAIPQTALASVVISEFAEYIRLQTGGQADVDTELSVSV